MDYTSLLDLACIIQIAPEWEKAIYFSIVYILMNADTTQLHLKIPILTKFLACFYLSFSIYI